MKYVTARRITCSEDKEATTYMVRACDKNGRRRITVESIMALCCRIKGKRSECCASRKMLQSKIKAYSKQWNLQETERHGIDSCRHLHHCKMMGDKERKGRRLRDKIPHWHQWRSNSCDSWRIHLVVKLQVEFLSFLHPAKSLIVRHTFTRCRRTKHRLCNARQIVSWAWSTQRVTCQELLVTHTVTLWHRLTYIFYTV